ncbi:GreA/GreB family elongation factor [Ulvibacterium sp.]|uniref:GreA/GreB family elongation factor n=1 Tax=Ulvibacterium sp. TaxID=2665914 RepID=UPI003BA9DEC0
MKYGGMILEKKEYLTLKRILNFHKHYEDYAHKDALERLKESIDDALVKDEEEVPSDVVRLYSRVTLSSEEGGSRILRLVPPSEENTMGKRISVISTLGANLIGLAAGDTLQMEIPSDTKSLKITKVEKPHQRLSDSFSGLDF